MAQIGVCMVTDHFFPYRGGLEVHTEDLSSWLVEQKVPVMLVTRPHPEAGDHEVLRGIDIYRVGTLGNKYVRGITTLLHGLRVMAARRGKFDVIHTHTFGTCTTLGYVASKVLRRPLIINVHRGAVDGDLDVFLKRRFSHFRMNLYKNDPNVHFISISEEITQDLLKVGVDAKKINYRVNGIDAEKFHSVDAAQRAAFRQKLGLPMDVPIIIYVGRHTEVKGLEVLLKAWEQVPEPAHLVLVGIGPVHEKLKQIAAERLPGRVTFPGRVESVIEYMQASDGWTLPSFSEGLPISMLEAMACGLPLVTTAVGGIPQMLENGVTGWLVPAHDVESLANALRTVVTLSPEVRAMGQRARQEILDKYVMSKVAETYRTLYQEIVNGKK